jgi:glycerophosphoryl diester phosphodiesterase
MQDMSLLHGKDGTTGTSHAIAGSKAAPVMLPKPLDDGNLFLELRLGIDALEPGAPATAPISLNDGHCSLQCDISIKAKDVIYQSRASQGSSLQYVRSGKPYQTMTFADAVEGSFNFRVEVRVPEGAGATPNEFRSTKLLGYADLFVKPSIHDTFVVFGAPREAIPSRMFGHGSAPIFAPKAFGGEVVGHVAFQYMAARALPAGLHLPEIHPSQALRSPPAHDRTFWKTSHLFGHRGSGADNAAIATPMVESTSGAGSAEPSHVRRTHMLENTLLALMYGARAGAEFVEYDVMLSRDGVPVIHHDWGVKMETPTNIRVPVSHLTASQFLSLPPQVMSNDRETDETIMARTADVAAMHQVVLRSREKHLRAPAAAVRIPTINAAQNNALTSPTFAANRRRLEELGVDSSLPAAELLNVSYSLGLRDRFVTLEDVLLRLPSPTGANIEVKYPTHFECAMFGIRPPERNYFVERILEVIGGLGVNRPIMFSSFDPDICSLLVKKQNRYPVFFLTEAGTPGTDLPDARMNSLAAAVGFAVSAGLFGIVTDVTPILSFPSIIDRIQQETGLVLCSYGRRNNSPEVVEIQYQHGIGAVIADHVAHITRTLRASR